MTDYVPVPALRCDHRLVSHTAARYLVAAVVAATAALEVAALGLAAGVVPLGQPVLYAVPTP